MFKIEYAEDIADDLAGMSAYRRRRIFDQIEAQLLHQPTRQSRNRKLLVGLKPPWDHVEPVWELRVGEFRVFYDVDETAGMVKIRVVRHKPPHKTTEEIL